MPTVDIVLFPAHASPATPLGFEGIVQNVLKTDGMILFSYEDHMKLAQDPSYPGMISPLTLAMSGPTDVQHVDFDEDGTKALDAPATEIVLLTLKPDTALADLHSRLKNLKDTVEKVPTCHAVAVGESRDKNGTWFILMGWDSIQAHKDVAAKPEFQEIGKSLFAIADVNPVHIKLVEHTG
ncbi:hypothetical protein H0H81_010710 [Sphagnurus paluster]|uniref:ABM domain-containing protein n=1 Tax=Sphagnurus paluster TaxID=117069 RepID=A0A9P7G1F2_9AGAR|nr:hypothetical protein H0H81_010710 [Sphagnurus paluster]